MEVPRIQKIEIEDDFTMQDQGAIEVTITLSDGTCRWCYFMTPAALHACGDWIDGTEIRFHFGAPYMIVVADRLTEDLIKKALRHIEQRGEILLCTKATDSADRLLAERCIRAGWATGFADHSDTIEFDWTPHGKERLLQLSEMMSELGTDMQVQESALLRVLADMESETSAHT